MPADRDALSADGNEVSAGADDLPAGRDELLGESGRDTVSNDGNAMPSA